MKKILIISPFNIFPPYWGGASRIYNLAKNLANNNKIWLLCNNYQQIQTASFHCKEFEEFSSNPNIKLFFVKSKGKVSQIFNTTLINNGLEIIKKEKPDFILGEFTWSGLHSIFLRLLTKTPYILDEHNIEFLRFRRMKRGNKLTRFILKVYEKISCNLALKIFCVSDVDRDFLISELGIKKNRIEIIPNGVDAKKFYPSEEKKIKIRKRLNLTNKPIILFFGKLDYKPNFDAVKIIREEILPRVIKKVPEAKFLIVGDNPPYNFIHESLLFTGAVDNIEDFVNSSDVVICPLLSGGGTRLKILEALACGKIVISTSLGAEGLMSNDMNEFLKICDNWDEFSNEIVYSIYNKVSKTFGEFINRYSWEKSCNDINKILVALG